MNRRTETARHALVGGNRSGGRPQKIWVLVLLGVAVAVGGMMQAASSSSRPLFGLFGCHEELGPMVIANIDCTLGVADAFAHVEPVAATGESFNRLGLNRAPWCDEFVDLRIYGCALTVPGIGEPGSISCAEPTRSHFRLAENTRAANLECQVSPWLQHVLGELAENKITTDACLALVSPGPACIP